MLDRNPLLLDIVEYCGFDSCVKQTVGYVLDKAHFVVPESTDGCVKNPHSSPP